MSEPREPQEPNRPHDPAGPSTTGGEAMPEGEEHPPAGVRTMAIVRWVLVAAMGLLAAIAVAHQFGVRFGGDDHQAGATIYYCPMHPQIQQDHPGECPICGMTLVPKPTGKPAPGTASGTDAAAPSVSASPARAKYACPMHPQITSDDPKARCSICGMKLEPVKTAPPAPPAQPAQAPPGLAPVELAPERVQLIGVRTEKAARTAIGGQLRTVGAVEASERGLAQITTRFSGWVETLEVSETGQRVRKGQVLATIYSPEVLQAQEELLSALRWAGNADPGTPTAGHPGHLESSQSLVADARHRLELLGIAQPEIAAILSERRPHRAIGIRSPVDGFVLSRHVLAGMAVQPGMALFQVGDLSTVWVLADVYEADAGRVRVGQPARFNVAAYPGQVWKGKVQFIYPLLDSESRTLRLRIELPNRGGPALTLRPGMFGDVVLDLPGDTGLTVPSEAVVDTGQFQYVFVANSPGRFEPRLVKLGGRSGDRVVIREGLSEGESVVTTANFLIDSESRLRSALRDQPPGAR